LKELDSRVRKLSELLGDEIKTLPELALRYILFWDEISTVIPGIRKAKYAQSNIELSDGNKLSFELMEKLKKHTWERNFYSE